jgi:hypothetical protein
VAKVAAKVTAKVTAMVAVKVATLEASRRALQHAAIGRFVAGQTAVHGGRLRTQERIAAKPVLWFGERGIPYPVATRQGPT